MKKHLLLFTLFLFIGVTSLNAQAKVRPTPSGPEGPVLSNRLTDFSASPRLGEMAVTIGITWNDIQTNGSTNHRLLYLPDGSLSAIWHYGIDDSNGFPDRGAGYNHYDGSAWGAFPTDNVEGEIRGGYPTFAIDGQGSEYVISHQNPTGSLWEIGVHKKTTGSSDWVSSVLDTDYENGLVWAKAVAGGANNQTLHVIAITLSPAFGGTAYLGLDQHLLYYRSTDGGDTWDIKDMVIPGCDSTAYNDMDSEAYVIDARGDVVSVGVFPFWGDARIFKSVDNGTTWSQHIMHDFPLDKYDEMGYTVDDIPEDPDAPDSLAIATVDNSASIVIDNNNMVHAVVGAMYVLDGNQFFPGTEGLLYWNESFGDDSTSTIALLEDLDGDDLITLSDTLPDYFMALTSMASMGVDADDNLFVAYAGMREDLLNVSQNQNLRHIYLMKSMDGGNTWTVPFNVINDETVDPAAVTFIECVWPAIPRHIQDRIPLIYQQDLSPGMSVFGDEDPGQENAIVYFEVDKEDFSLFMTTDTEEPLALADLSVYPNPNNGWSQLEYSLREKADVQISVYDLLGKAVWVKSQQSQSEGIYQEPLNLGHLAKGVYLLRVQFDDQVLTQKISLY